MSGYVHARLPHKLRNGDVFLLYIVLYPLGRFLVEFFRPDAWTMGGLATAQWIAIACVVGGTSLIVLRHIFWDRDKETGEGQPGVQEAATAE